MIGCNPLGGRIDESIEYALGTVLLNDCPRRHHWARICDTLPSRSRMDIYLLAILDVMGIVRCADSVRAGPRTGALRSNTTSVTPSGHCLRVHSTVIVRGVCGTG